MPEQVSGDTCSGATSSAGHQLGLLEGVMSISIYALIMSRASEVIKAKTVVPPLGSDRL